MPRRVVAGPMPSLSPRHAAAMSIESLADFPGELPVGALGGYRLLPPAEPDAPLERVGERLELAAVERHLAAAGLGDVVGRGQIGRAHV